MICPMVATKDDRGANAPHCVEDKCAWWIQGKDRAGGCSIPRISHYLAALLETQRDMTRSLDKVAGGLGGVATMIEEVARR